MFTARYGLGPYIIHIRFVFEGLIWSKYTNAYIQWYISNCDFSFLVSAIYSTFFSLLSPTLISLYVKICHFFYILWFYFSWLFSRMVVLHLCLATRYLNIFLSASYSGYFLVIYEPQSLLYLRGIFLFLHLSFYCLEFPQFHPKLCYPTSFNRITLIHIYYSPLSYFIIQYEAFICYVCLSLNVAKTLSPHL